MGEPNVGVSEKHRYQGRAAPRPTKGDKLSTRCASRAPADARFLKRRNVKMKNHEKHKTFEEREKAFGEHCKTNEKETGEMNDNTSTGWAEADINLAVVAKIAEHYCHARAKHPYFADLMFLDENDAEDAKRYLGIVRTILNIERKNGELYAETLVNCEVAEICEAISRGDKAHAVEECYDAIAVLLRMVDVMEGRQKLGKPKEGCWQ